MEATFIIPAHNEAASLHVPDFGQAVAWIRKTFGSSEIILVDDGSTDETVRLAGAWVDEILQQDHQGKAAALQAGFARARGARVFWSDADWSVPVVEAAALNAALSRGYDYALASRGWGRPGAPLHRWLSSCFFTAVIRQTFDWSFRDTQCGLKGARREALDRIVPALIHFGNGSGRHAGTDAMFDIECLLVCRKLGLRAAECPVRWMHFNNRTQQNYSPLLRQIYSDFKEIRRLYHAGHYEPGKQGTRICI